MEVLCSSPHGPSHVVSQITPPCHVQVAMAMQQQLYPPTEILFQRGDKINRLLIIMRGIVVSAGQIHVKGTPIVPACLPGCLP